MLLLVVCLDPLSYLRRHCQEEVCRYQPHELRWEKPKVWRLHERIQRIQGQLHPFGREIRGQKGHTHAGGQVGRDIWEKRGRDDGAHCRARIVNSCTYAATSRQTPPHQLVDVVFHFPYEQANVKVDGDVTAPNLYTKEEVDKLIEEAIANAMTK